MENIKLEKELSILKNKLIISIFVTIVLCIVLWVYTYPELKSVSNIKNELLGKISEYDTYVQKWITDVTTFDNLVKDPALKKLLTVFFKQEPTATGGQSLLVGRWLFMFSTVRGANIIINHQSKNEWN